MKNIGLAPDLTPPAPRRIFHAQVPRLIRVFRGSMLFGREIARRDCFGIFAIRPALGASRRGASLFIGRPIRTLRERFARRLPNSIGHRHGSRLVQADGGSNDIARSRRLRRFFAVLIEFVWSGRRIRTLDPTLARSCSTTELHPRPYGQCGVQVRPLKLCQKAPGNASSRFQVLPAEPGTGTTRSLLAPRGSPL